jgi:hypothetical protein
MKLTMNLNNKYHLRGKIHNNQLYLQRRKQERDLQPNRCKILMYSSHKYNNLKYHKSQINLKSNRIKVNPLDDYYYLYNLSVN